MNEKIEKALEAFLNNEDCDEGSTTLRGCITSLKELRFALATARQKYDDSDYDEILECLIELD